ncbi:MAG: recombinase family protein [Ignavibacteriae bacterium]|nr:recombinase family protein [Ignavibacteriota bacterium]
MPNALVYCRVSTEEQAVKGFSLDVQEKLCRDFAGRNGYDPIGVYRDEGRSGTSLDRPALKDLLQRCQQQKDISAVIVQETDRLARNTKDHLTIRAVLQKANVKLISVAQPMLDDSPEGNMIDTILASVNQFQSDINSRKTKKSLQEKFDRA